MDHDYLHPEAAIKVGLNVDPTCLGQDPWTSSRRNALVDLAARTGLKAGPDDGGGSYLLIATFAAGTDAAQQTRETVRAVRRAGGVLKGAVELPTDVPGGPRQRFAQALTRLIIGDVAGPPGGAPTDVPLP